MARYVLSTLAQTVVVMALASVLLFLMLHVLPGDPAQIIAGETATPEDLAQVRAQYGLDKPLVEQYSDWLGGLVRGDLGKSTLAEVPVADRIRPTLLPTFELAFAALFLALLLGVPLGAIAGANPGTIWDHGLTAFTAVALGVPGFALGVLVLLLFAVQLHWLPPGGRVPIWEDPVEGFKHILLPASTAALGSAAVIARFVRAGVQNSLLDDYGRTARAKGLRYRTVVFKHALPNSLIPLITVVALQTGRLLGGAAIIEQIFNWPGLGRLVVNAVGQRDYLVVQGALAIFVTAFVVANASADTLVRGGGPATPPQMTAEASTTLWGPSGTTGWRSAYAVQIVRGLLRHPQGAVGAGICLLLVFAAVFAPFLAPNDPAEQFSGHRLEGPSLDFFFGTDEFSRDIFSRMLYGLRSSLLIGVGAVALGGVAGTVVGLLAGYVRGPTDLVISRFADALLAFPALVGAIAIVTALGPSMLSVAFALAVFNFPGFVRLARASALVERERDYVLAVTSVGASRTRILIHHVTPNALTPLVVQFAFAISFAILAEAGLSFLGLGIRPPAPSIGGTLNASRAYMTQSAGYVIFPAVTIALLLTALNLVADALNDVLDPRRRH